MPPRDSKELVVRVTSHDCQWEYFRAGGKGGQNQNKTNSGVRVRHLPSGAVAESRQHRDQLANRREAWSRLARTPEFTIWAKVVAAKLPSIDSIVEREMRDENLLVEYRVNGEWINDQANRPDISE